MAFRPIARLFFLIGPLAASAALAQISGGVFRGDVRDTSNAVVTATKISIRSAESGTEVSTESNSEGIYVTPTLIPGTYVLTAIKSDFKTEVFGPVTLQVNQTVRVDFHLNVGPAAESVQVEASAAQLLATE